MHDHYLTLHNEIRLEQDENLELFRFVIHHVKKYFTDDIFWRINEKYGMEIESLEDLMCNKKISIAGGFISNLIFHFHNKDYPLILNDIDIFIYCKYDYKTGKFKDGITKELIEKSEIDRYDNSINILRIDNISDKIQFIFLHNSDFEIIKTFDINCVLSYLIYRDNKYLICYQEMFKEFIETREIILKNFKINSLLRALKKRDELQVTFNLEKHLPLVIYFTGENYHDIYDNLGNDSLGEDKYKILFKQYENELKNTKYIIDHEFYSSCFKKFTDKDFIQRFVALILYKSSDLSKEIFKNYPQMFVLYYFSKDKDKFDEIDKNDKKCGKFSASFIMSHKYFFFHFLKDYPITQLFKIIETVDNIVNVNTFIQNFEVFMKNYDNLKLNFNNDEDISKIHQELITVVNKYQKK